VELTREVHLTYRCKDHPAANGRQPQHGDVQWDFHFTLEDGTILHLLMGKETHDNFRGFLLREELDDAADEAMANL
jgi:hypothetical protein